MPLVPLRIVDVLDFAPFVLNSLVTWAPEPLSVMERLIIKGLLTINVPALSITTCPAGALFSAAWIEAVSSCPLGESDV